MICTYGMHVVGLIISVIVSDLGTIINLNGALCSPNLAFIIPGVFYIMAQNKYQSVLQKSEPDKYRVMANLFIFFGVLAFIFLLTMAIVSATKGEVKIDGDKIEK